MARYPAVAALAEKNVDEAVRPSANGAPSCFASQMVTRLRLVYSIWNINIAASSTATPSAQAG